VIGATPAEWRASSLESVTSKVEKRDPVEAGRHEVRYVDIGSIDGSRHRIDEVSLVEAASAPSRCRQILRSGDTVFSTVRPYLEKIAYIDDSLDGEFASTGFCVLRPSTDVLPKYLFHFASSRGLIDQVLPLQRGVSYPAVLDKQVRACTIPLPGKWEQSRIVDILEDHLSRLEAAEADLGACLRRLDVLDRAIHQRALRGELIAPHPSDGAGLQLIGQAPPLDILHVAGERVWPVPDGWLWIRLGDVFSVAVGTTPSRTDPSAWGGDVPWVSSGEVAFGRIGATREMITRIAAGESGKRVHPPGTVMLAMIGEGKTRGQAAILDIHAAHNQNCASIRVSETDVLPEYVYAFLKERYLETRRDGAGGNQPALNKRSI